MAMTGKTFLYTAPWLALLPEGMWFDVPSGKDAPLEFQTVGRPIEEVREKIGLAFGLSEPWRKEFNKLCNWWEYYNKTANGVVIRIYGDTTGPASCRRVEETVEEWQDVPVSYERRLVAETRVRWVCPDD